MRLMERAFLFEEQAHFPSCHASTLLPLTSGELLCAYFAGTHEKHPDVRIFLSRRTVSGEWLPPKKIVEHAPAPCWNPVLFEKDGRVELCYKIGESPMRWQTYARASADGGARFSDQRVFIEGEPPGRGPVRAKPLRTQSGAYLYPGSFETEQAWDAFVDRQAPDGTLTHAPIPIDHAAMRGRGVIQPVLWEAGSGEGGSGRLGSGEAGSEEAGSGEAGSGEAESREAGSGLPGSGLPESGRRVCALMRSTDGYLFYSESADDGRTFSPARRTGLPNNNSGVDVERLPDGRVALVLNPTSGDFVARTPLEIWVARADTLDFERALTLEDAPDGEFSYPAMVWARGALHISYTHNRTRIAYARVAL